MPPDSQSAGFFASGQGGSCTGATAGSDGRLRVAVATPPAQAPAAPAPAQFSDDTTGLSKPSAGCVT
ncbi:hypothetical protein [Streptomyces sp. YU58]|uniref:hypothetical protein n=1 Tax=Streptomyces sp. SX92 TaxID=3158972 RepID=UPI0027BB1129|nr:hypothetical protein [Streptomyces coralus]WLW50235.1 hypothetical protein QU709_02170 [Streptomyces coralus]